MKKPALTKRNKMLIAAALIVIVIGIAAAAQAGAFLCSVRGSTYAGQAVDGEQAIAKVKAFAGAIENNSMESLVFDQARARSKSLTVWQGSQQVAKSGFVVDVPYSYGGFVNYGHGYLLASDGTLYRLSGTGC